MRPAIEDVPDDLRPLVPLALRWGIADDEIRFDVVDRASGAEKRVLFDAFRPHMARIAAWLDSIAGRPMTEEAAAFMALRRTLEEMDFYVDPDAQRQRWVKLRATPRP